MVGGPPSSVASPSLSPAVTSKSVPPFSLAIDSAVQGTLEAPGVTAFPITSSQSPRTSETDARSGKGFKENTKADETKTQAAATTDWKKDYVQDDDKHPSSILRILETPTISSDQLVAIAKEIYSNVERLESECLESDSALDPRSLGLLDVTKFLEMIPFHMLIKLQDGKMLPHNTVRKWFIKLQESDKIPSTPEPAGDTTTTPADMLAASEYTCTGLHVPEKTVPQAPSPKDCFHGFMVALGSRARAEKWPEHEKLARLVTAELDEKRCQEVLDGEYLLHIGGDLVDKLLRDLEVAKQKAEELPLSDHTRKTEPNTKQPPLVEYRPLDDRNFYKKVGNYYYVLLQGIWVRSYEQDDYKAIVQLHGQLIGEHHDFFLASQYPLAIPELRAFAEKYVMARRMWVHGIFPFLEALRHRLPESSEFLERFILQTYHVVSALEETVPVFRATWIEFKADLARYRYSIEQTDMTVKQHWKHVSQEEYTRVLQHDPTIGHLYHHLAVIAQPQSPSQPDACFNELLSQLFYLTKSLVVERPFFPAREQLLTVLDPFVAQNQKQGGEATNVPQTDQDHFLTAVAYLCLASIEPEFLRAHGYKADTGQCLQALYTALEQIGRLPCTEQAQTSRIRPSAQLGLLLCQLLLGIPRAAERWSPMMAEWAPDLVTPEDRADVATNMAKTRDIHNATITIIDTMVSYLLEDADTRELGLWGFIHVILVFMRSLKARPELLQWVGEAFHAELLAPFLDMLIQNGGRRALECATRPQLTTLSLGYAEKNDHNNPLPEHELLRGHFFAREAGPALYGSLVEVQRQEAELRDLPLFPEGWFKGQRYDFEERRVRQDYVQDAEMCDFRSNQILCLAAQLKGVFFRLQGDGNGWHWINMPGAPPVPPPRRNKGMPEVVEWNEKSRVVFVDPSFNDVEMEKERNRRLMEEDEKKKNAEAIEANKKGDADKLSVDVDDRINDVEAVTAPTSTQSVALEDEGHVPISTGDMELVDILLLSTIYSEGHEDKTLLVGSSPVFQDTAESDAGVGIGRAITPVDVVQPTEGMLDTVPGTENATDVVEYQTDGSEDDWAQVSCESRDITWNI